MKCSQPTCAREAEGGFRRCPNCRKVARKCQANNRKRGACQCGRDRLGGYSCCQRCHTRQVQSHRRRHGGYSSAKHLYVASTAFGIKIGASVNPVQRVRGFKWDVFANMPPCNAKLLKTYDLKGYLEPFIHYELAVHRVRLPSGRLSTEVFSCDLPTVIATIDHVLKEMPSDESRGSQLERIDGARAPANSPSTPLFQGSTAAGGARTGGGTGASSSDSGASSSGATRATRGTPESQGQGEAEAQRGSSGAPRSSAFGSRSSSSQSQGADGLGRLAAVLSVAAVLAALAALAAAAAASAHEADDGKLAANSP